MDHGPLLVVAFALRARLLCSTTVRLRRYWRASDGTHDALFFGRTNDGIRSVLEMVIRSQVGDDPELLAKVLPDYPPFCSRVLWIMTGWPLSNGKM